jgi:hypothetical protein
MNIRALGISFWVRAQRDFVRTEICHVATSEPPHLQIDHRDDQSGISHVRLDELRRSSPVHSHDKEKVKEQSRRQGVSSVCVK